VTGKEGCMGTKDKSQKSTLLYKVIIVLSLLLLAGSGYYLNKQNTKIEEMNTKIESFEKKVEEQESLINQQKEQIQSITDENIHLKDTLEKRQGEHQEVIQQKDQEIQKLEKDLTAKREAEAREVRLQEAKVASYSMPSRGQSSEAKEIYFETTGYTAFCDTGCTGITATGINLAKNRNAKVVAVDPNVVPLGTKVWVEGYGYAIAGDTGGAIDGYKLDLHFATKGQAREWGRKTVRVKIFEG
jgi:3D (Asp-Asp-Asp) domain-containing protein/outer membrane murein-binding lipoprotein Lpp